MKTVEDEVTKLAKNTLEQKRMIQADVCF
jgi:hypothetical protein